MDCTVVHQNLLLHCRLVSDKMAFRALYTVAGLVGHTDIGAVATVADTVAVVVLPTVAAAAVFAAVAAAAVFAVAAAVAVVFDDVHAANCTNHFANRAKNSDYAGIVVLAVAVALVLNLALDYYHQ